MDELVLAGQAPEKQIAEWKAKNERGVYQIPVRDKIAYFRKPTRDELKSTATMGKHDPIGMIETLMNDTFLGGDRAILEDDDYFFEAASAFQELVTVKVAELKKL